MCFSSVQMYTEDNSPLCTNVRLRTFVRCSWINTGGMKLKSRALTVLAAVISIFLFILFGCEKNAEPLTVDGLLSRAEQYLLEQDYERALSDFLAVTGEEPDNLRGHTGMAEVYIALGNARDAAGALKNNQRTMIELGLRFFQLRRIFHLCLIESK